LVGEEKRDIHLGYINFESKSIGEQWNYSLSGQISKSKNLRIDKHRAIVTNAVTNPSPMKSLNLMSLLPYSRKRLIIDPPIFKIKRPPTNQRTAQILLCGSVLKQPQPFPPDTRYSRVIWAHYIQIIIIKSSALDQIIEIIFSYYKVLGNLLG
jgi:hypothetical protein